MILLLGALIASVLPSNNVKAQATLKPVRLTVQTIDRAPLQSATAYGFTTNTDTLSLDVTDARFGFTGTVVDLATATGPTFTLTVSDNLVSGSLPTGNYPMLVIVANDINGRAYIYGFSSAEMLNMGIFRAAALPESDTISDVLTIEHLLYANSVTTVARDGSYTYYTSLTAAAATAANSYPSVTLTANIPGSVTDVINNSMAIFIDTFSHDGTITIAADSTVYIAGTAGGTINLINTDELTDGAIVIDNIDSIGIMAIGSTHPWEIRYARVKTISTLTSASNLTILDGKFNTTNRETLTPYLAAGRFIYSNTDADAADFKWKVATDGYKVTFVNFNAAGNDSVARCEGGLIVPAAARPSYVAPEWLFQHYYTDAAFTNPWFFDQDSVTSDTVLYAKWEYYDPTVNTLVRVNHYTQNLDDTTTFTLADSVDYSVLTAGPSVLFRADTARFPGFYAVSPNVVPFTPAGTPDTINFYYKRNAYTLTWVLNNGPVTAATSNLESNVVTMLYGQRIEYPIVNSNLPGYRISGWTPAVYRSMPNRDLTLTASYNTYRYDITWNGPEEVVYNAKNQIANISAIATYAGYTDSALMAFSPADTIRYDSTNLVVLNANGDTVPAAINVVGSPYTIKTPVNSRNNLHTLNIIPFTVNAVDIEVEKVRYYEQNNQTAVVTNYGRPDTVLANDNLYINPDFTARFSDEEPGENKVITAYGVTLGGTHVSNYVLAEDTIRIATDGVILYFGLNDTLVGGFDSDFKGYCNDNSYQVEFHLDEGASAPDMYSLDYESDLFRDVTSATINQDGFIDIVIPDGTPAGVYNVSVVFWSSAYPTYKSTPYTFSFIVNLDKDVIMPIFDDVMTVMNADPNMIIDTNSVVWYHSTDGGNTWDTITGHGPFYQEEGGALTGLYYVEFNYSDSNGVSYSARSCVQENVTEYPEAPAAATVKAYPNPTVNTVNIAVENSTQLTHTLRVMNIMGVVMLDTTFDGDATSIDFSRFINGSYTVAVDGMVVRVIKK